MIEFSKRLEWAEKLVGKFSEYDPVVEFDRTNGWVRVNFFKSGPYLAGYVEFQKSGKIHIYCKELDTEEILKIREAATQIMTEE